LAASFLSPKPRNFTHTALDALSRQTMIDAVAKGKPGTAMQSFANTLSPQEIEAVVDFVREEFMREQKPNTHYHTAANGWPDHERYRSAYPFALGELPLDTPDEQLSAEQLRGKQLFMNACVSCHDRAKVKQGGTIWEPYAVSYPRNQYRHTKKTSQSRDTVSGATPYAKHDIKPSLSDLTQQEQQGEQLFQQNCAFCHGADGTGKNWIGSFLDSHPRNLTDPKFMSTMTRTRLKTVIQDGLLGTTMSAWKNVLNDEQIDSIIAYINRAFYALNEPRTTNHEPRTTNHEPRTTNHEQQIK
jgi:cytochrome c oxidase cbb3-type subunit 3